MICAASAHTNNPINRLTICNPWSPRIRSMRLDKNSTTPTVKLARAMPTMAVSLSSQCGWLTPITSKAPMVPGPTVSGMVSGTMVTSCCTLSVCTADLPCAMPSAEMNSTLPAPIRKASTVMPNTLKITRPNKYSRTLETRVATATFQASRRCSLRE
ncbi:hypothetical protein D3C85_1479340 [compost metagenome]